LKLVTETLENVIVFWCQIASIYRNIVYRGCGKARSQSNPIPKRDRTLGDYHLWCCCRGDPLAL